MISVRPRFRRAKAVRHYVLALIGVLLMLVGCGMDELPDADDEPEDDSLAEYEADDLTEDELEASSPEETELDEVPELGLESSWTRSFSNENSLSYALSADGELVTVAHRRPDRTYIAHGLDAGGEDLWEYRTSERDYVSADVRVLEGDTPEVGLALYTAAEAGDLRVVNDDGEEQFAHSLEGSSGFHRSPDGDVLALLDRTAGDLLLVDGQTGDVLGEREVGEHATADFVPGTELLLLQTEEKISIVDRAAESLWSQNLDLDLRGDVEVADEGHQIALTTVDPDNVLYVFDRSADLLWKYLLPPGGNNDLCIREDNAALLVYNVGAENGVFLMDMESGEPEWSHVLQPTGDEESLRIDSAAFDGEGGLTLHLVTSHRDESQVEEKHRLVFICPDGEIEGQQVLGVNVGVDLAGDGGAVVVATGDADPETGARILDSLTYYDLNDSSTASSILQTD